MITFPAMRLHATKRRSEATAIGFKSDLCETSFREHSQAFNAQWLQPILQVKFSRKSTHMQEAFRESKKLKRPMKKWEENVANRKSQEPRSQKLQKREPGEVEIDEVEDS